MLTIFVFEINKGKNAQKVKKKEPSFIITY
jgi:hypothetical protein